MIIKCLENGCISSPPHEDDKRKPSRNFCHYPDFLLQPADSLQSVHVKVLNTRFLSHSLSWLRVKIGFNWLLIPFNPQQQWFMAVFPGRCCSCFYTSCWLGGTWTWLRKHLAFVYQMCSSLQLLLQMGVSSLPCPSLLSQSAAIAALETLQLTFLSQLSLPPIFLILSQLWLPPQKL